MTNLKQVMEGKRLHIPQLRDLVSEIGGEIAELTATGKTKFYHRSGTHDDRLWALALAVYGARYEVEAYHPAIAFGKVVKPWWYYHSSRLPCPWPPARSQTGY